jgi:hypothetical protein
VYSEAGVDEEDAVKKQIKTINKKYKRNRFDTSPESKRNRSNYLAELIDSMKLLLEEE